MSGTGTFDASTPGTLTPYSSAGEGGNSVAPTAGTSPDAPTAGTSPDAPTAGTSPDARAAAGTSAIEPSVDAGMGSPPRSCNQGSEHGGYCWFLGAAGQSCDDVCQSRGSYEPSLEWVGSTAQGGALARCDELLTLLTMSGNTTAGTRFDRLGLGCHLYSGRRWWLYTPDFDPVAKAPYARIVCSCIDP